MAGVSLSPDQIIQATYFHTISEYTTVAGSIVYYYDLMLTWSTELELLWQRGSVLIKTVYLINRYLPMIGLPALLITINPIRQQALSLTVCTSVTVVNVFCQCVGTICTTTLFTLRIRSLFVASKWIRRFLLTALLLSHAAMTALTFANIRFLIATMKPFQGSCIPDPNPIVGGNYAPPLIIEAIVLGFTVYHAVTFKKSTRMLETSQSKGILRRLYVEGALYFFVVAGLRLWSACMFAFAAPTLQLLSLGTDYAVTGTVTSRFFLNLRQSIVDANSSHENSQYVAGATYGGTEAVITGNGGAAGSVNPQITSGYGQRRTSKMFSQSQRRTIQSGSRLIRSHGGEEGDSNPELDGLPRLAVISSVDLESARSREESKDGLVKASGADGSDGDIELDSFGTRTPK